MMQNRTDIILEYTKYILALKGSQTLSQEEVTKILSDHGLSEAETQLIIDAANIC